MGCLFAAVDSTYVISTLWAPCLSQMKLFERAVSWHFLLFMHLWTSWIHIHSFWHALHVLLWGMKVFKTVQWQGRDDERAVQFKRNWKWSAMQTRPTTQTEQRVLSTVDSNVCGYLQTRKFYCLVVALLGDLMVLFKKYPLSLLILLKYPAKL